MAKKAFSIAEYIKPDDVSNLDHSAESGKIIDIPIDQIACNPLNFYDTSNVDELVKSIALNGLLEPVIVKPSVCDPQICNGMQFYALISGHRRFKAFQQLNSEEPEKWTTIPAIIREPANPVVEELMLIEANRATRVMSSADTLKQAERYKALLVELKNQGVEIPGRLRDVVAEAMQISASRLARLEVIRKNLSPELMPAFESAEINESTAYALAQIPEDRQLIITDRHGERDLPEWKVRNEAAYIENLSGLHCKNGCECTNKDRMFEEMTRTKNYNYMPCKDSKTCCGDCSQNENCKALCPQFAETIKKKKAKAREEAKQAKAAEENKKLNQLAVLNKLWIREGYARQVAGVSHEKLRPLIREPYMDCRFKDFENGDIQNGSDGPDEVIGVLGYIKLAKLYGCSVDYLLCLTDNPSGSSCAPAAVWRPASERPAENSMVIVRAVGHVELIRNLLYKGGKFVFPEDETTEFGVEVKMWIPYPEEPRDE